MVTWSIRSTDRTYIASVDQLSEGQSLGISIDGRHDQLFITLHESQIRVWLNDCPHHHRPLEFRKDQFLSTDGTHIVCYAHSAHFDKLEGLCFAGPCKGQYLTKIPHIEINGAVYIENNLLTDLRG